MPKTIPVPLCTRYCYSRPSLAHFLLSMPAFCTKQDSRMESLKTGTDALFLLLGAAMVLAMHAGFAFLELGTVRKKNQVNALVKILVDFSVSTIAYFFIGYTIAYGVQFFDSAGVLAAHSGYAVARFFFLLTFRAAIPAILSGGIPDRSKFHPPPFATFVPVRPPYPLPHPNLLTH